MSGILITTLVLISVAVAMIFHDSAKGFKFPLFWKITKNKNLESAVPPKPKTLDSCIELTKEKKDDAVFDIFNVKISGTIHAPNDEHHVSVRISITDITDGISKAKPVHGFVKRWQQKNSPDFCYNAEIGKLPNRVTILSDWMIVAGLHIDCLIFPLKGKRNLQFNISILSNQNREEIAYTECDFTYENTAFGYVDLKENALYSKALTIPLAIAVAAANNKIGKYEVALIKNWLKHGFDGAKVSGKTLRKLNKSLRQIVSFYRDGDQIDICEICREIVEIAPVATRYDILNLCLRVVRTKGIATANELAVLKELSRWLEVDENRFRTMTEKVLPVNMHEVEDVEIIFGITPHMGKDRTRRCLNKEYRKWNARVTNVNSEIQAQAGQMLELIAKLRSEYTEDPVS